MRESGDSRVMAEKSQRWSAEDLARAFASLAKSADGSVEMSTAHSFVRDIVPSLAESKVEELALELKAGASGRIDFDSFRLKVLSAEQSITVSDEERATETEPIA